MVKRTLVALLLGILPQIAMAQSTPRPTPRANVLSPAATEAAAPDEVAPRTAPTTTDADSERRSRSSDTYYRITTPWANNQIRPGWQR